MSGAGGLVRRIEAAARATFLELFFDVVFVFALDALAQQLLANLTWNGAFQTLVVLLALGWTWSLTARITVQLNPARPSVQLMVILTMVGALVLSAAVPQAFGRTGLIFATTYVVIQIGRSVFLIVLLQGHELEQIARRAVVWHTGAAVPLVTGALTSGPARTALWTLAIAVTYMGRWFNYRLPGVRPLPGGKLPTGGEYMADRYRALFVIGLGEVILSIGSSVTRTFTAEGTVAFVVTFAVLALIWRVYIFRAGQDVGPAMEAAANPDRLGTLMAYAHLVMIEGLVVTSVGDQLVITSPFDETRGAATLTLLGGPALFLAGRSLLGYLVFGRSFARSRLVGVIVLACLLPPMLYLPPLAAVIAAGIVLVGVVIADNRHERRPTPIAPPGSPRQ